LMNASWIARTITFSAVVVDILPPALRSDIPQLAQEGAGGHIAG
jgi:hypothetical protein